MEKQTGKQAKVIVEVPAISNGMDLGDRRREWSRWPTGGILRLRAAPQRRSSALLPGSRAGYEWPNPIG